MAGPAPKTKDWTARENLHKPKGLHLLVCGLVEVSTTNKEPVLAEAPHVGKTLPLDLTIVEDPDEPVIQVVVWKAADFHKVVSANQYERVEVRWDGKTVATFPVIDDTEHSELLEKQVKLQNIKYAEKPKKTAAKEVAAKKATTTVTKKAAKKVAKKAAKKAAPKKAAPKKAAPKKAAKKAGGVAKAVGGWAKGVGKALKNVLGSATKKSAKKAKKTRSARKAKPAKKVKKAARKGKR